MLTVEYLEEIWNKEDTVAEESVDDSEKYFEDATIWAKKRRFGYFPGRLRFRLQDRDVPFKEDLCSWKIILKRPEEGNYQYGLRIKGPGNRIIPWNHIDTGASRS